MNLPLAILCDLDGTLAIHNGRSPFDYSKIKTDILNEPVKRILDKFSTDCIIILVSGRDACSREDTEYWLKHERVKYDYLYMRPENDTRKDSIVKKEIYDKEIKDKYNVLFVIDDRKQVKRMWVRNGVFVLDVNQTDREF